MVMEVSYSKLHGASTPGGISHSHHRSMAQSTAMSPAQPCVPMFEVNVRKYNLLTKDRMERSMTPEDCCTYCDHYQDGAMTVSQKFHIEEWRQNVAKSTKVDKKKSASSQKKRIKLKFLKYSPPGVADEEPGFRRIRTPKDKRHSGTASEPQSGTGDTRWSTDHMEVVSLSSDIQRMSLDNERMPRSSSAASKPTITVDRNPNLIPKNAFRQKNEESLKTGKANDSKKFEYKRCTSNTLLNCLTIDDYKSRYGSSYSRVDSLTGYDVPSHVRNSTISENSVAEIQEENKDDKSDKASISDKSSVSSGSTSSKPSHTSTLKMNGQNDLINGSEKHATISASVKFVNLPESGGQEVNSNDTTLESIQEEDINISLGVENQSIAVRKAFDALLPSSSLDDLQNGNPPYDNVCGNHLHKGKASRRFRRLHRNLHQWMEEEVLQPQIQRCASNMSGSSASQPASAVSSSSSIQSAKHKATTNTHRQNNKPMRQRLTKKKDKDRMKLVRDKAGTDDVANCDNGDHKDKYFLEMLMEMDSDVRDSKTGLK